MKDDRSRNSSAAWLIAVVVLVVLYTLSVGPFVWLSEHGVLSPAAVQRIQFLYYPIAWLRDNNTVCEVIINWYLGFWM